MYVIRAKKDLEPFRLFIRKPRPTGGYAGHPLTAWPGCALKFDSLAGARAYIRSDARKVQELIDMGFDLVPEPLEPARKERA